MSSPSRRVLAKKYGSHEETLEEHTSKALDYLLKWFDWKKAYLDRLQDKDETISRTFAMVYLHDIGKATEVFQDKIRNEKKSPVPHSLLALPFLVSAIPPREGFRLEALAVLSHHGAYHQSIFQRPPRDYRQMKFGGYCGEVSSFYHRLVDVHQKALGRSYPFNLNEPTFPTAKRLLDQDLYMIRSSDRDLFSLYVSALHYSDWLASGSYDDYCFSLAKLRQGVGDRTEPDFNWYPHQILMAHADGNILVRIPTGKGKTEGSMLWAQKNNRGGKVIYLLPTRVTSNAMYGRMRKFFGNYVGISHGTASLLIADEEGWGTKEYMSKSLLSSAFMYPLTVATVDQSLLSCLNWYRWEMIEQNMMDSLVVFDEIHCYDEYTLSLILNVVDELSRRGARFSFMSATFPKFLEKILSETIGDYILIENAEYDNMCRHRLHFLEGMRIEDVLDQVFNCYKQGRRILTILNTVDKAVEIYDDLVKKGVGERDIELYHSRFIERDRRVKESTIEKGARHEGGFVAVTTQVVEVSLDIDYDVLFSEVAPMDALVQRLGRVNRRGEKGVAGIVDVFVCEPYEESSLVYGEALGNSRNIVSEFDGCELTEALLKKLVELQYPTDSTLESIRQEVEQTRKNLRQLRAQLQQIQTIQLSDEWEALRKLASSRREKFPSVEIIPQRFSDEVKALEHLGEVANYVVRVPLYKVKERLFRDERRIFADVEYDEKYGVHLERDVDQNII